MSVKRDVCAAWLHSDQVAHSWFTSILSAILASPRVGPYIAPRCGTDGIVKGRNQVVEHFLATDAQWLWWTDTDMGFKPDTLDRLLEVADPVERPIVGALCFAQNVDGIDGYGGHRFKPVPTLYRLAKRPDGLIGYAPVWDYPRDELVQVSATGSACVVVHRSVFEAIRGNGEDPYARMVNPSNGDLVGEDLSFCARAGDLGFPVHVHTGVKTTHLKPIWLQEADYLEGVAHGGVAV